MATDAAPGARTGVNAPGRAQIGVKTLRTDNWRQSPLIYTAILLFFIVYTVIRIFMNKWYYVEGSHLLTPVYSPCISKSCVPGSSDFGTPLPAFPTGIPLAILVFPILAGFRGTCYYYRKAGYRSLWLSPQACGVAEPHAKYTGERRFPLIVMNYHRYFFVLASILLLVNTFDALKAFEGKDGGVGMGVGTVLMVVNVVMLWLYSLSCHACRHIVGGRLKHFSKHPVRYQAWTFISKLNPKHGNFAMASLTTVILTDFYIMSASAGWITDLRFFN
jgi:hypothetical protein